MLNLIRYKNLIFIIAIVWVVFNALINPILHMNASEPLTPIWVQWALIIAITCIAAGGYIINDYFDIKIDRINRPQKVIVSESISKKKAMLLYQSFTGVGIAIGIILSVLLHNFTIGFIFVVVPGMLWFYSASYKRQFLIGNIIIAATAAIMFMMPLFIEAPLQMHKFGQIPSTAMVIKMLYGWTTGFALFVFLWTLIREIIKDAQDINGDREMECRTIPIVCGETVTKIIVSLLIILTTALMFFFMARFITTPDPNFVASRYALFGIALPTVVLFIILWSNSCQAYKTASGLCKYIMAIGLIYIIINYYLLAKAYGMIMFGLFKII